MDCFICYQKHRISTTRSEIWHHVHPIQHGIELGATPERYPHSPRIPHESTDHSRFSVSAEADKDAVGDFVPESQSEHSPFVRIRGHAKGGFGFPSQGPESPTVWIGQETLGEIGRGHLTCRCPHEKATRTVVVSLSIPVLATSFPLWCTMYCVLLPGNSPSHGCICRRRLAEKNELVAF